MKRVRIAVPSEVMAQLALEKLVVTSGDDCANACLTRRPGSRERTRCGSCAPHWAQCGLYFLTSTRWCSTTCIHRSRSCLWNRWPVRGPGVGGALCRCLRARVGGARGWQGAVQVSGLCFAPLLEGGRQEEAFSCITFQPSVTVSSLGDTVGSIVEILPGYCGSFVHLNICFSVIATFMFTKHSVSENMKNKRKVG